MRLRAEEFRPRAGRYAFRVVQPRPALRHTTLVDPMRDWGYLVGDHDGLARLAGLFSFAAYSPHTVVHVPLRQSIPRDFPQGVPVDLVLVHQTLGLRPSTWPALRRGLTHGVPRTVRTDERRTARHAADWEDLWERRWDRLPPDRPRPARRPRPDAVPVRRARHLRRRVREGRPGGRLRPARQGRGQGVRRALRLAHRTAAPVPGAGDGAGHRLPGVSAPGPLHPTGAVSQASTSDSSFSLTSSGAAEPRMDCRASSASSASVKS